MTKVLVKNHLGRTFSVPFIVGGNKLNVKTVVLQQGSNILDREEWDAIKKHPSVVTMLESNHTYCFTRRKLVQSPGDKRFSTGKFTYNEEGSSTEKKVLEVYETETKPSIAKPVSKDKTKDSD